MKFDEESRIKAIMDSDNPFSRKNSEGHITTSGLAIKGDKVLLIFHPYIERWLQPGGHVDEGESPVEAAIREVHEETGYVCELDPDNQDPIDIDIHEIPENSQKGEGTHLHIDLLFRLKVLGQEQSVENIKYQWFSFAEVENIRIQRALARLA